MKNKSHKSKLIHKQLPSRYPFFSDHYAWCLKDTRQVYTTSDWEKVTCQICKSVNQTAKSQGHPLSGWHRAENYLVSEHKISQPLDVLPFLADYAEKGQEHFIVLTLNSSNEVIKDRVITIGLVNQTQVHPREVFTDAIQDRACGVILAHNHPSGSLTPSNEDIALTNQLISAGKIVGIDVLDHVIVARKGMYSFLEHGLI